MAIMDRKSCRCFHISCTKPHAAPFLAYCPFSFPCFGELTNFYDCYSISNIKAHVKRLNANLISYMKQSWFTFYESFFLGLQTTQCTPPSPPRAPIAGIMPFNMQSKESGRALWTVATILRHPHHKHSHSTHTHTHFPAVDICPQQVLWWVQR